MNFQKSYQLEEEGLDDMIFLYACLVIGLLGFVLNFLCIIILFNREFKENFYNYLKIECAFEAIALTIGAFRIASSCKSCPISNTLFSKVYFVYFLVFANSVFEMCILTCQILSAYTCYAFINRDTFFELFLVAFKNIV